MQLLTIVGILVAAFCVVFALQNNVPTVVEFMIWRFESSLAIVLLLTLALGAFIVALMSTPATLRRQWATTRQNKHIAELEKTCSAQKETIADLEKRIPVADRELEDSRPFLGLKQIFSRTGSDDCKKQNPPPAV